jgi:hypothetical protein
MDVLSRERIPRPRRRIGDDGDNVILQRSPQRFLTWNNPCQA